MNSRLTKIGFSQRVRLEWLEKTANLVLAGNDEASIYNSLQKLLEDKLSVGSNAKRGNREKVITILMRIWVRPPRKLLSLHQKGLNLLLHLHPKQHIAVHWGMTSAVYPFWSSVATYVGRLLKLQKTVSHAQIRRRVMEQYGQRSTVKDAIRRVLRSMVDWGVLRDFLCHDRARKNGLYTRGTSLNIERVDLIAWLFEILLHIHPNSAIDLREFFNSMSLFPFRISPIAPEQIVSRVERLELLRYGLEQEFLILNGK